MYWDTVGFVIKLIYYWGRLILPKKTLTGAHMAIA